MAGPTAPEWSGERVQRWLAQAEALERQLAPVSELLFTGARLQAGERVLDVGFGSGPTTREAAAAVGRGGHVTAVDISAEMVAAASAIPAPAGAAPVSWIQADVGSWEPAIEPVDVVISRFGVMFFEDPAAAFANLAAATRPGGRLCAMTWDRRDRSPLFQVPMDATVAVLRAAGQPVEDLAVDGGAFSLSDDDRVRSLLEPGGWRDVALERHRVALHLGGGLTPAEASTTAMGVGPTRVLTSGLDDELRAQVASAIEAALAGHRDDAGQVVLGGAVVRLTAVRA